jgi:hypothetical protein
MRQAVQLALDVANSDRLRAALPAMAKRGEAIGGQIRNRRRTAPRHQRGRPFSDVGTELAWQEPQPRPTHRLDVVARAAHSSRLTAFRSPRPKVLGGKYRRVLRVIRVLVHTLRINELGMKSTPT